MMMFLRMANGVGKFSANTQGILLACVSVRQWRWRTVWVLCWRPLRMLARCQPRRVSERTVSSWNSHSQNRSGRGDNTNQKDHNFVCITATSDKIMRHQETIATCKDHLSAKQGWKQYRPRLNPINITKTPNINIINNLKSNIYIYIQVKLIEINESLE